MLQGYKTYVTIIVMALFNVAQEMGLTGITAEEIQVAINVILGVLAFIFNYVGRKRLKGGK
jgi:uncharacterized membrane protein